VFKSKFINESWNGEPTHRVGASLWLIGQWPPLWLSSMVNCGSCSSDLNFQPFQLFEHVSTNINQIRIALLYVITIISIIHQASTKNKLHLFVVSLFPFFFQLFLFSLFFLVTNRKRRDPNTARRKKNREVIAGKLGPNPAYLMRFLSGEQAFILI
jgi:hypothetical protein